MYSRKLLQNLRRVYLRSRLHREFFSSSVLLIGPQKFTARLLPEIEDMLEKVDLKHRKHPGIRKCSPVSLPDWILRAIEKVLPKEDSYIEETAENLKSLLYNRRLPIERYEINQRTSARLEQLNVSREQLEEDALFADRVMKKIQMDLSTEVYRWKPINYTKHMVYAYLITRLAPNYACVSKVFDEILLMLPSFKPSSFFDFGCGVGSATWAAHNIWKNNIKEYYCVDTSSDMINLMETLAKGGDSDETEPQLKEIYFRQFLPTSNTRKYDLVVSAFSLMELSSLAERMKIIDILWQKTNDVLVIIENARLAGFTCVLEARDYIMNIENKLEKTLTTGAYVVAPCPHEQLCPLFMAGQKKTCYFKTNYYSPYPKQEALVVKQDYFSYVVLRKGKRPSDDKLWPRVIKTLNRSRKVYCNLCNLDGKLHELILTKKRDGRHIYRCTRESAQGDLLPVNIIAKEVKENECEAESSDDEENNELLKK